MYNKYPLVYVTWEDNAASGIWEDEDEIDHTPSVCVSVGWLVREDIKGVTLMSSIAEDTGQMGNKQYILKRNILRHKVLRKAKKSKESDVEELIENGMLEGQPKDGK